jgi:pimeloyl-ACP methyl ester carboxylesterase
MDTMTTIFGAKRSDAKEWNPYVVVRHGILSSEQPFQSLAQFIKKEFPKAIVDNQTYRWTDSVVLNGARIAKSVQDSSEATNRPVVLIGHSMGGLVCRVAGLLLSEPDLIVRDRHIFLNYYNQNYDDLKALSALRLDQQKAHRPNLVVTLGTPNSGAMLKGQISALGDLLGKALAVKFGSLDDLNTARLFRLFQYFSSGVPTLSISGSGWSRMSKAKTDPIFWAPHLAARLHLPNDMIVEDRSVDLAQSIFPNEVLAANPPKGLPNYLPKYLHVRVYEDCTEVTHTTMYDNGRVRDVLIDAMERC